MKYKIICVCVITFVVLGFSAVIVGKYIDWTIGFYLLGVAWILNFISWSILYLVEDN